MTSAEPRRATPSPPHLARREERRIESTLRAVSVTFLVVQLLLISAAFLLFPASPKPIGLTLLGVILGLILVSLELARRKRIRLSAHVLIWITWGATTAGMIGGGGIATPGFSFYAITIVAAGLLLGGRMAAIMGMASAAGGAAVGVAEAQGWLPEPVIFYANVASFWWIEMTLLGATTSLIYISVNRIHEALGDAERSEQDLAVRNLELSRTLAEKQRAEEGEALLGVAMTQAREAILVVDVNRQARFVNSAFETLTEISAEDLQGGDIKEFFGELTHELGPEVLTTVASGEPWHGRVALHHPRELLIDASLSAVVDTTGATTHFVAVARDVTREVALEADLHQSQKLEALGQLAGGVAHDFNNLLAVIQGYAEIVRSAEADPELRESVEQIEEAARQAAGLTSQLLAFGRRQISQPRVVDLNGVVREADGMLRTLVPESIAIEFDLDTTLRPVRLDPRQIHQILLNLAANARDAMPDGGQLTIVTRQSPSDQAELLVTDTGEGMDEGTRERIFEPFFTTKRPGEGTGLGLASVYGIVEQCGGTIEVESTRARGSQFRITFPNTAESPEATGDRPPLGVADSRASLLVVEDQDSVRRLLGRQLQRIGFDVSTASDGLAALEQLDREPAPLDLLVTDVTMPRLGGAALADQLRERWPELPVLYISGYWPDDLVAKVEADEHADFLAKPFTQRELVEKIERLLATRGLP